MIDPIDLLKRYWQPLAIALIIGVCILRVQYYKSSYEHERDAFTAFKQDLEVQAKLNDAKNKRTEKEAKDAVDAEIQKHVDLEAQLNLDRNKLAKDLQNEIIQRAQLKTLVDNKLGAFGNRMSIDSASYSSLSSVASNSAELAQTERERDSAYIGTLEQAGASCALDFNLARGLIDIIYKNY